MPKDGVKKDDLTSPLGADIVPNMGPFPADGDEEDLQDPTGEQVLLSRIPQLTGGPKTSALKADYLGYRATGFPIRQACYLAGISQTTLNRWRRQDSQFAAVETERLPELLANLGNDLVRLEFLRNMRLAIKGDFKVLMKAVYHLEGLSDREFQYLKRIRALYSPQELLSISKALAPESEAPDFAEMVLKLTQRTTEVEVKVGKVPEQPPVSVEGTAKEV